MNLSKVSRIIRDWFCPINILNSRFSSKRHLPLTPFQSKKTESSVAGQNDTWDVKFDPLGKDESDENLRFFYQFFHSSILNKFYSIRKRIINLVYHLIDAPLPYATRHIRGWSKTIWNGAKVDEHWIVQLSDGFDPSRFDNWVLCLPWAAETWRPSASLSAYLLPRLSSGKN